jgi:hypothetical protein
MSHKTKHDNNNEERITSETVSITFVSHMEKNK